MLWMELVWRRHLTSSKLSFLLIVGEASNHVTPGYKFYLKRGENIKVV